jgi:hypothetical protein
MPEGNYLRQDAIPRLVYPNRLSSPRYYFECHITGQQVRIDNVIDTITGRTRCCCVAEFMYSPLCSSRTICDHFIGQRVSLFSREMRICEDGLEALGPQGFALQAHCAQPTGRTHERLVLWTVPITRADLGCSQDAFGEVWRNCVCGATAAGAETHHACTCQKDSA